MDLRFGPFQLSPAHRQLRRDGQPLRIGGRALDLLSLLAARAGQVVGKDELMAHAWPGGEGEDTRLRFHITALRRLLGDHQDPSRYIANVSGRGYCFVAAVHAMSGAAPPLRLTPLLGREDVFARLAMLLPARRLVTLVGPGGMGKSALAQALAARLVDRFPGGIGYLDLAAFAGPAGLLESRLRSHLPGGLAAAGALAGALPSSPFTTPPAAPPGQGPPSRQLLVLDHCDHLVGALAPLAATLLAQHPSLHLLATSREALAVPAEERVLLGPLDAPAAGEAPTAAAALAFSAVQLFVARASASLDRFRLRDEDAEAAGAICRRLDGMPFAIELVAAQVEPLGVAGLLDVLDDGFPLRTPARRGVPARHRTLESLLDWSYQQLSADEQSLLRRLALLSGSFDQQALLALPGSPQDRETLLRTLSRLAARSLVAVDAAHAQRPYRLLDTTRLYALDKLAATDEHTTGPMTSTTSTVPPASPSPITTVSRVSRVGVAVQRGRGGNGRAVARTGGTRAELPPQPG